MDILKDGLLKCGIQAENIDDIALKMEAYIKEIILFNSAYNLTNTSDHDELVIRHVLDSLSAYKSLKTLASSLKSDVNFSDIGSGGGLPGIPLACAFPEYNFFLVERMSKRCSFLENVRAILKLQNVEVVNSEAENYPEEASSITVFRAFRPLDKKMTKTLLRLTKTGGYLAAYKAKMENIKTEMDGIKDIVKEYDIQKLSVPYLDDTERNLVIIKKQ